jgi:TRAP-type C4-dicarboxylate transport system substrate-binding protein
LKKQQLAVAEPPRPPPSASPQPPAGSSDARITLKLGHWMPATHSLSGALDNWARSLQAAAGGTVKTDIFPARQLGGRAPDYYDMARDGILELSYINPGLQPGRFPIFAASELPLLMADAKGGSQALDGWYRKYAEREMKDVKFCFAMAQEPGLLHSRAKKVLEPGDIRGMQVRPANATLATFITQLGGITVPISTPEVRTAVEKSVIDAVMFSWGSAATFGIDKVTKYHMDVPFFTTGFALVMGKAAYERMSAAQRKAVDEHCSPEWALKVATPWADFERAGLEKSRSDRAREVYKLSPEQVAQWRRAAEPTQAAWADDVRKAGGDPGAILGELRAALARHNAGF